jgi:hypothetical protein
MPAATMFGTMGAELVPLFIQQALPNNVWCIGREYLQFTYAIQEFGLTYCTRTVIFDDANW